jgi:hypothetical protein
MGNQEGTIKNGQSRMDNQEWTIKNGQSRMNNQEWTIKNGQSRRVRNCLSFASNLASQRGFGGERVAHLFSFLCSVL